MKKIIFLFAFLIFLSCKKESQEAFGKSETSTEAKNPVALGEEIFLGKGACVACHKPDLKLIGPSLQDIAKIYKEKNGDMVSFLKGEGEPIVDPTKYEIMRANFAVIKTFSDEEIKALEAYVYSTLK